MSWFLTWFRSWFPTFVRIYRWWMRTLTLPGKAVCLGAFVCVPGMLALESSLIQLFSAFVALLLVAWIVNRVYRPRVSVTLQTPSHGSCGEPLWITVLLENRTSRTAFDLSVELTVSERQPWEVIDPALFMRSLPPGGSASCRIGLRPLRRGLHSLPAVRLLSTFPLNLFRFRYAVAVDREVIVTPQFTSLDRLELPQQAEKTPVGENFQSHRAGSGWDYFGSREYMPGLPTRRWDYSSWARLGYPVVREFCAPRLTTAAILVDTMAEPSTLAEPSAPPGPCFEAAMSLTAALVEGLLDRHYEVHCLGIGGELHLFSAGTHASQQQALALELLALAVPTGADEWQRLDDNLQRSSLQEMVVYVVCLTWDSRREQLCRQLAQAGCEVRPLLVVEEPTGWPMGNQPLAVPRQSIEQGGVQIQ